MSVHSRTSAPSILDVATQVLLADPTASLADVAAAAGVSRTTLHKRYPTRQDLLLALADDALDRVADATERARLDVPGEQAVDALRRAVRLMVPLGPRLEFLLRGHPPEAERALRERAGQLDRPVLDLVERAQQAGVLRADLPPWWFVSVFNATIFSAWEAVAEGRLAPLDAPDLVMTTVLHGVATEHRQSV